MSDLVNGNYPVKNQDWLLAGSPAFERRNLPRFALISDLAALTTQVLTTVALPLQAGDTITNLSFKSGATAAGTPTNWFFALYDPTGALLSQSVDQLTAAWAANTRITLALGAKQTAAAPGVYYAGVMVKATSTPTLLGATLGLAGASTGITAADKILAQTSGSALTTTAPTTIATPTAVATVPLVVAS